MFPAGYPTLLAECDPSGGDVAAWAQLPTSPGWSTAVSGGRPIVGGDRRQRPAVAVRATRDGRSGAGLAGPHRGRRGGTWVRRADGGGARRRHRRRLRPRRLRCAAVGDVGAAHAAARPPVGGVGAGDGARVSIGRSRRSACCAARAARSASCSSAALHTGRRRSPGRSAPSCSACFPRTPPVLPSSPADGRVGKRASRSPLAKAAATLGERVVEAIYGRDHRPEQLWAVGGGRVRR